MRVEPIPGSLVKAFWDRVWGLVTRPVADLGGLGCVLLVLLTATVLVLLYRVALFRRFVHAILAAAWMAVAISVILIAVGGG